MKECTTCHKIKELEDFPRRIRSKDGRDSYCHECNRKRTSQWRKDNPDKVAERRIRRGRQLKDLPGKLTKHSKEIVKEYYGKCLACGTTEDLTVDHVIPIGHKDSTNYYSNLQVLCMVHNSSKHVHMIDYRNGNVMLDDYKSELKRSSTLGKEKVK